MGLDKPEFCEAAAKVQKFPFKSKLHFGPIIKYWETLEAEGSEEEKAYAADILKEVRKVPAITKPIANNKAFLKKHKELVHKIMSAVFPKALHLNEIKAAYTPFEFQSFIESPRYAQLVKMNNGRIHVPMNMDEATFTFARYLHACLYILAVHYQYPHTLETPFIYLMKDPDTGLDNYYKMTMNGDFLDLHVNSKPKDLSKEEIDHMTKNVLDVDLWQKNIPPKNFELHGFVLSTLVNVTLHELLSNLKNNLLERNAIITDQYFEEIRHNVRSLFRIPDLKVGLGVFKDGTIDNFGHWVWRDLVCKSRIEDIADEFKNSIYQKVMNTGQAVIVEDLEKLKKTTGIEEAIKDTCIRSFIVAPLKYDDEVIGYLELGSCEAEALNTFMMARVEDILPLFSIALRRSLEERDNLIDAIIMEKCTAIHNSVQWRFKEAAQQFLKQKEQGRTEVEMSPIVFEDVYPLYGMADIRDSSLQRNLSIQADLVAQIESAQKVIQQALGVKEFPILKEIDFRLQKLKRSVKKRLRSEEESQVYYILQKEVEPLFDFLLEDCPEVESQILKYKKSIDPKLGVLYSRRKSYEESVTKINQTISEFLEQQETTAQEMYPHYFEKYKTDGVDYNIYVGQSLLSHGTFNQVCLNNMRLWQLIMMSEMTRVTAGLVPSLPIPLETAQLILVHDDPLAIRFRADEKKFDVDGAYNIRYEIVKKRIDKAYIKNTEERLTQPGKIAIVYSNADVYREYMKYCDYLYHKGFIEKEVEELELEADQGVTGLKALRIKVRMEDVEAISTSEIEEIISSLQ